MAVRHDAAGRQPDEGEPARPRLLRRRPQGRRPAARTTSRSSASPRSTSTRSSTPARTTRTTRRTTRRSTRTSAPRRTSTTSSSTPRPAGSGSSSTASSTTCRRTARCSTATTTTRRVGACESTTSPYRSWFVFTEVGAGNGRCAGAAGPDSAAYEGWFGFDSIPVLRKTQAEVQSYFLTAPNSIAKRWIKDGASGWRLDVSGDPSFPNGYWESFRSVVKAAEPAGPDRIGDLAEGLDAAADDPWRPARHDDELPAPRRGPRPPGAADLRLEGLRRQRPPDQRLGLRRPARIAARGLPGRRLLLADEPARQPRHGAPALDARRRVPRRPRDARARRPTWPRASSASGSPP